MLCVVEYVSVCGYILKEKDRAVVKLKTHHWKLMLHVLFCVGIFEVTPIVIIHHVDFLS